MSDSDATYDALLVAIDAQLATIAANPTGRFTVGRVTYDGVGALDALVKLRDKVMEWRRSRPAEAVETITGFLDDFGRDFETYANEPDA